MPLSGSTGSLSTVKSKPLEKKRKQPNKKQKKEEKSRIRIFFDKCLKM